MRAKKVATNQRRQLRLPLAGVEPVTTTAQVATPAGYRGLYAFHKYWGKKPYEPISFMVQNLTAPGEVVFDPFVGSGVVVREAARLGRRFIGVDLNPMAVEISRLLVSPPDAEIVAEGLAQIEKCVREQIEESYARDGWRDIATHYLWEGQALRQVWAVDGKRRTYDPTAQDAERSKEYQGYQSRHIRPPRFFENSRINTFPGLALSDLFTGRALRNMDLLLDAIDDLPAPIQPAFRLCLTAACGQMSNMVFAITGRGKTKGSVSSKIEVGSWVIGYWRPTLHFEINVWDCFVRRAHKLLKSLEDLELPSFPLSDYLDVLKGQAIGGLSCNDALETLRQFPTDSVDLVLTDPPHSDRVPYLELNELWNAILGYTVDFQQEIVVSDARERNKGIAEYNRAMQEFLVQAGRVVKAGRFLVLLFNTRDSASWEYLHQFLKGPADGRLDYKGHFPLSYSARSVVQDSRKGSLKHDFALVFQKPGARLDLERVSRLQGLDGWSGALPAH